jgi:hypothetical protein
LSRKAVPAEARTTAELLRTEFASVIITERVALE